MLKGGSGIASISDVFDDDPYKEGKTKVNLKLSNVKLTIGNDKRSYIIEFKVDKTGFTKSANSVDFYIEFRMNGHWRYTSSLGKANLSKPGSTVTLNVSQKLNGNASIKKALTDPEYGNVNKNGKGNVYLLFNTSTEICSDQIKCQVETI